MKRILFDSSPEGASWPSPGRKPWERGRTEGSGAPQGRHTRGLRPGQFHGRRAAGFSLVEILIALAVLAIGLVSVFALFGTATLTHRRGVDHTQVSLLAQAVLAEVKGGLNGSKAPSDVKDQAHPAFPDQYRYDVKYEAMDDDKREYRVKVTVKWRRGGEERSEEFETVLLRQEKVETQR